MRSSLVTAWVTFVVFLVALYFGLSFWLGSLRLLGPPGRAVESSATNRPILLEPGPRPLTALDEYPLIERSGANFKFDRLAGHVWVADVFFSSCPHECKLLTAQLHSLQTEFPDLRLVSITCDPDNDTPERLRAHAELPHVKAERGRWFFLTGKMYDIQGVCQQLFGHAPKGIEHSRRVAVINRNGDWHGMYDVFDEKDMTEMRALITRLLAGAAAARSPATRPQPPEPTAQSAAS